MPYWFRDVWPYLVIAGIVFAILLVVLFKFVPRTRLNATIFLWMGTGITISLLLLNILAYDLGIFRLAAVFSKPLTLGSGLAMIVWGAIGLAWPSRSR